VTTTQQPTTTRRIVSTEVLAAAGVVALGSSFLFSPEHIEDGPVICPFRRLTGLPCPGCGLTRSWTYLTHGWWQDSLHAHPFGPLLALVAVLLAVAVVRARVRRTPPPSLDRLVRHPVSVAVIVVWLGWAVVRAVLAL